LFNNEQLVFKRLNAKAGFFLFQVNNPLETSRLHSLSTSLNFEIKKRIMIDQKISSGYNVEFLVWKEYVKKS